MKKLSLIIVAFFIALLSVVQAQGNFELMNIEVPPNPEDNAALVNRWFEAKIEGDIATVKSLTAKNFQIFGVDAQPPMNREMYLKTWEGYLAQNKEQGLNQASAISFKVKDGEMAGDWVIFTGEAYWTPKPMDERIVSWFCTFAKIEKGKVVLAYHFQDSLAFLMQAGYTLNPPSWAQAGDKE